MSKGYKKILPIKIHYCKKFILPTRLEIFVWTFGGILLTQQVDILSRINSSLIFRKNFFNKKCNESLRQLLRFAFKDINSFF